MMTRPDRYMSVVDKVSDTQAPGNSITLRMAFYALVVCGAAILFAHLAVKAAMRAQMLDHQRVLSALTPMLPDNREGVDAADGPIALPESDTAIDLRGVSKGALITTSMTDRAYCRGLRPSLLWSDGKRAYQLAAMDGANHDWDAASVLLGAELTTWLQTHCVTSQGSGVERLVAMTPFDDPAAAYADHEHRLILIVMSMPGRQPEFDELVSMAPDANPIAHLIRSETALTEATD